MVRRRSERATARRRRLSRNELWSIVVSYVVLALVVDLWSAPATYVLFAVGAATCLVALFRSHSGQYAMRTNCEFCGSQLGTALGLTQGTCRQCGRPQSWSG